MDFWSIAGLQCTFCILIFAGVVLKKRGIVDDNGKKCLTDLCIEIILPCNIIRSFLIDLDWSIFRTFGVLLFIAALMQVLALVLNQFLYNRASEGKKRVMQYCTVVSNAAFLGYPVVEGVYGTKGLLYASIYIIPQRLVMWAAGTTYFEAGRADRKKVIRNIFTHPCIVATYIGIFLMVTGLRPPGVLESAIRYIASCNSAITLFIVGTILADVKFLEMFDPTAFLFSALRLVLLPAVPFFLGRFMGLDHVSNGAAVILAGMPAGATAALFAARYNCEPAFASKCVVLSTVLSMFTVPVWCWLIG